MRLSTRIFAPVFCAAFVGLIAPAHATFHLWAIKEVFSSADGTVQFIEFFTTSPGETDLEFHSITANSDGMPVTFTFDHGFTTSTANKHFLLATAGFGSLPGSVTPDFSSLPANFFNPHATSITITFPGVDTLTISGATLPKDGVTSLTDTNTAPFNGPDNLVSGVNSPTNFAGAVGSVNVGATPPSAADFNEDGDVDGGDLAAWQDGFGMQGGGVGHMDGDADADSDVDGADFLVWQQELGASNAVLAAAGVPEPTTVVLLALAASSLLRRRRRGTA